MRWPRVRRGDYRAAPIAETCGLGEAQEAYRKVAAGAAGRIVPRPRNREAGMIVLFFASHGRLFWAWLTGPCPGPLCCLAVDRAGRPVWGRWRRGNKRSRW